MKNREAVIRSILIEQLDELTDLSKVLYDGSPVNHDKIQAIHNQVQQLEEQLSVYKFIRLIAEDEDFNLALMSEVEVDESEINESESIEKTRVVQMIHKIEEFEETIAEEAEIEESLNDEADVEEDHSEATQEEEYKEPNEEGQEEVEVEDSIISDDSVSQEEEQQDSEEEANEASEMENNEEAKPSNEDQDINSKIAQIDSSLVERLKQGKVDDLRSAIALNQRFLFSNELFQGNMEAFNLAVNELNNLDGYEDATRLMEAQLFPRYQWNVENEVVKDFVGLVKRRYL